MVMNKEPSSFNFNKVMAPTAAAVLGLGSVAAAGCANAQPPVGECYGPRISSDVFPGDKSPGVTNNPATWNTGLKATFTVPLNQDQMGSPVKVEWGHGNPNPTDPNVKGIELTGRRWNDRDWDDSEPIAMEGTSAQTAFALGPDQQRFSAQIVAANGSAACDVVPTLTLEGPQDFAPLKKQGLDRDLHYRPSR